VPHNTVVIAAVAASGVASSALDLQTRRVPNWLTLGITAVGISLAAAHWTDRTIAAAFVYTALFGGALALTVAVIRGRLHHTLQETATLVVTGGANVAQIERPSANNRFAYAPAIALGALVAALGF